MNHHTKHANAQARGDFSPWRGTTVTTLKQPQDMKPRTIAKHSDLVALFNEDTTRELHLHLERDCGTHSVAFYITTENEKVAEGVMNTETNDELAWAVLDDCYDDFDTVTEYDSLVAGTNPGTIRA